MKKVIIFWIIWMILFLVFNLIIPYPCNAANPKFKVHIIKNLAPGVNYSINCPITIDYDCDGDEDILIINKEGIIYFLENITNE